MKHIMLPAGPRIPVLGLGTWNIGNDPTRRTEEIAALRLGIDLGMTLIDTAEMYGEGQSEELVGEAIQGRRDQVFLVTKVYPHNASRKGIPAACERSLRRLGADRIDLYLLHWRGSMPVSETLDAFAKLQAEGKIQGFGVSNFDITDLEECCNLTHGREIQTDQVLYNLGRRSVEHNLLPWCRSQTMPVMAYSPVEHGRLLAQEKLQKFASSRSLTPAQIALAWLLAQEGVIAIPKAGTPKHVEENRKAMDVKLDVDDLRELDRLFPRPKEPKPLEML